MHLRLTAYSEAMNDFYGVIIEESLTDNSIMKDVDVVNTVIEQVNDRHKTPWLKQWTLHEVIVPADSADSLAERLSTAIERSHSHAWYVDYKNDEMHYIIFPGKVFKVTAHTPAEYDIVTKYGIDQGIPHYQLDFTPINTAKGE